MYSKGTQPYIYMHPLSPKLPANISNMTGNFNSYLLNTYYAIVDLLTFIYIIYFDFLQQYQISIIIPI